MPFFLGENIFSQAPNVDKRLPLECYFKYIYKCKTRYKLIMLNNYNTQTNLQIRNKTTKFNTVQQNKINGM